MTSLPNNLSRQVAAASASVASAAAAESCTTNTTGACAQMIRFCLRETSNKIAVRTDEKLSNTTSECSAGSKWAKSYN